MSEEKISGIADNSSWKKSKRKMERLGKNVNPEAMRNLNRSTISSLKKEERKNVLDNVIRDLPDKETKMVPATEEDLKEFRKEYPSENVQNFKVGNKEYRFNITDNIVKDIILQVVEEKGKDNLDPREIASRLSDYLGDKTSESIHFKFHKVQENDRLKYYQLLVKYANFLIYEDTKFSGKGYSLVWKSIISPIIENGKIFEIDESVTSILNNTHSTMTEAPFNHIILNCRILIEDRIYYGLMFTKYFINNTEPPGLVGESEIDGDLKDGFFSCYSELDKKDRERKLHLDFFDVGNVLCPERKNNKYQKRLISFFYSFCNFINEPEVTVVDTVLNPKNNKRRSDRGTMPLPANKIIRISGMLKKYVSEYSEGMYRGLSHRFIVRGHFMHFRDEKIYNKLYKIPEEELIKRGYQKSGGIIKKWLKPFQKGEGILVDKTYKVLKGGKEKC